MDECPSYPHSFYMLWHWTGGDEVRQAWIYAMHPVNCKTAARPFLLSNPLCEDALLSVTTSSLAQQIIGHTISRQKMNRSVWCKCWNYAGLYIFYVIRSLISCTMFALFLHSQKDQGYKKLKKKLSSRSPLAQLVLGGTSFSRFVMWGLGSGWSSSYSLPFPCVWASRQILWCPL